MSVWPKVVLAATLLVAGVVVVDARRADPPERRDRATPLVRLAPPAPVPLPAVPRPAPSPTGPPLLVPAPGGDGDSWRDDLGQEYRLGMVDAPEHDECFGPEATAERQRLTVGGFHATVYATDRYGRAVSVITLPDGANLNVRLARQGFVDDRFLTQLRAEHPQLAAELDVAFATARRERRGLWGSCPPR